MLLISSSPRLLKCIGRGKPELARWRVGWHHPEGEDQCDELRINRPFHQFVVEFLSAVLPD
jgi:hypothetical protein